MLGLSLVGLILGFVWSLVVIRFSHVLPVRLVWLSPLFHLIGGGVEVVGMAFYSMASDVTTDANR